VFIVYIYKKLKDRFFSPLRSFSKRKKSFPSRKDLMHFEGGSYLSLAGRKEHLILTS